MHIAAPNPTPCILEDNPRFTDIHLAVSLLGLYKVNKVKAIYSSYIEGISLQSTHDRLLAYVWFQHVQINTLY